MPSRSEYIRILVSSLGLPSEYDYWLREYSPNIPLKSITTNLHPLTIEVEAEMALLDASGMGGPDVVMPTLDPGGRNRAQ